MTQLMNQRPLACFFSGDERATMALRGAKPPVVGESPNLQTDFGNPMLLAFAI